MEHLSDDDIRYSEFYVKHREFIKRLLLFVFFFVDIVVLFNLAFRFIIYNQGLVQQIQTENSLTFSYIPFHTLRQQLAAKDLAITQIDLIPVASQKYDIMAVLSNLNEDWLAEQVKVSLNLDGVEVASQEVFVLPNSEQYLAWFNQVNNSVDPQAQIEIQEVSWHRIRNYSPLDIINKLSFDDPVTKKSDPGYQLNTNLINNSNFSFWKVGVFAIALRQEQAVAVGYTTLDQVKSGTTRQLSLTWPNLILTPQEVKLVPVLNVFDGDIFMPISTLGQPGDPSGLD